MTLDEFLSLPRYAQERVFNESEQIRVLTDDNPVSIEDIELFVKWDSWFNKHGSNLEIILDGLYPLPKLNEKVGREVLSYLSGCSDTVSRIIKSWRNAIDTRIKYVDEWERIHEKPYAE